ncbi:MAG: polysaccharide deacetylase family protein [Vulcanimicrobiaceae bacterium]
MKPYASLSLDLDNAWSYLKIHGGSSWQPFPSYLDRVVPRVLDFLAHRGLTITVFVVGQDAVLEKNHDSLASIARAGHEIANHSFEHEPWIAHADYRAVRSEIDRAHAAIADASGCEPRGFRGPGFATSGTLLDVLVDRRYVYDASHLPTFIGPLSRWYYFRHADLSPEEMQERHSLFGHFTDGFKRNAAHVVRTSRGAIVEIPVTTMPGIRTPIHCSYLLYLDAVSPHLADAYFAFSLRLCRLAGIEPSLLLHPLDFMGSDDGLDELRFFPGMTLPAERKIETVSRFIAMYHNRYRIGTMIGHAGRVLQSAGAATADPGLSIGDAV